ncbi:MAG TPA: recombinase family protein [Planctomycetota bacterium]|nr:recombinase family protein [Planctomycetota bacterium]
MNIVTWARVSSREQREGYSLDAQQRATRDRASRDGLRIVREFAVAESAKRGADRVGFEKMLQWVRENSKREQVGAILFHKLDRACRNVRDAVRLQDLKDTFGIQLLFVENEFGKGAAGMLNFNMMVAFSQYYSDNLRDEVLKGLLEKCEQGWLPASAPFGYINDTADKNEPIKPHPQESLTVQRIFELYSQGCTTFESLADQLAAEGHVCRSNSPRFYRTVLSYILNNKFYIGKFSYHGREFKGKHRTIIDRSVFENCQDILKGRNRRRREVKLPLAGGILRCHYCGQAITGEHIRRKLKCGGCNEHVYYRCGNDIQGDAHPRVRWNGEDVEEAILAELNKLKLPSHEVADWLKDVVNETLADETALRINRQTSMKKRESELKTKQQRLLDAFLEGNIEKDVFEAKNIEIRNELSRVQTASLSNTTNTAEVGKIAEEVINIAQNAADRWRGSNWEARRELLDILSLNRTLDEGTLCLTWASPFDAFAEMASIDSSRGDWI